MHGVGRSSKKRTLTGALSLVLGLGMALMPAAAQAEGLVVPQPDAPIVVPRSQAPSSVSGAAPAPAGPTVGRADSTPVHADNGTHIAPSGPNYEPDPPPDLPSLDDSSCLLACVTAWHDYYLKLWTEQERANKNSELTTENDRDAEKQYQETVYSLYARMLGLGSPKASTDDVLPGIVTVMVDTFGGGSGGLPAPPPVVPPLPAGSGESDGYSFAGLVGGLFDRLFPAATFQAVNQKVEDHGGGSDGAF